MKFKLPKDLVSIDVKYVAFYADADGCIDVPDDLIEAARAMGLEEHKGEHFGTVAADDHLPD